MLRLADSLVENPTIQHIDTKQKTDMLTNMKGVNLCGTTVDEILNEFHPEVRESVSTCPRKSSIPGWQCEPDRSHAMKDDTTRYPRTMVVFAIVMLGTGVERYALPVLLSLSVASLMLYEDYLDNRLCSSRLDYGRCCW
jgi:hypothetical protein